MHPSQLIQQLEFVMSGIASRLWTRVVTFYDILSSCHCNCHCHRHCIGNCIGNCICNCICATVIHTNPVQQFGSSDQAQLAYQSERVLLPSSPLGQWPGHSKCNKDCKPHTHTHADISGVTLNFPFVCLFAFTYYTL